MNSELEILARQNIPHDEKAMKALKNRVVVERRIEVHPGYHPEKSKQFFRYSIDDYAANGNGRLVKIGEAEFNSDSLSDILEKVETASG